MTHYGDRSCAMATRFDQLDFNVKWGLGGKTAGGKGRPFVTNASEKST